MSGRDVSNAGVPPGAAAETEAEFLARYDPGAFPCFAVTVDVVVVTIHQGQLAVLLLERTEHPARGAWALPGGFVGPDEDLPQAAWRILARETGLRALHRGVHLEQLATYGAPGRDPRTRVVSAAYLALTPRVALSGRGEKGERVRLWAVADLDGDEAPRLAFDHAAIVRDGVERARAKLEYTTAALAFVEEPLTLAELRCGARPLELPAQGAGDAGFRGPARRGSSARAGPWPSRRALPQGRGLLARPPDPAASRRDDAARR